MPSLNDESMHALIHQARADSRHQTHIGTLIIVPDDLVPLSLPLCSVRFGQQRKGPDDRSTSGSFFPSNQVAPLTPKAFLRSHINRPTQRHARFMTPPAAWLSGCLPVWDTVRLSANISDGSR